MDETIIPAASKHNTKRLPCEIGIAPEAKGRKHFLGCVLSAFKSSKSFNT